MLLHSLPLMMLGVVVSLIFTRNDAWDIQFDRPLYGLTVVMMGLGWLLIRRNQFPQQLLMSILVMGSGLVFITKMGLLLYWQPNPARIVSEMMETLIWLSPVVTWAMLTDIPQVMKRLLYGMLFILCGISVMLLVRFWQLEHIFNNDLFRMLAQFILSAFVTLYGASYYLLRSDHLGRVRGERDALARLAYTDLLTDLPNRAQFERRLHDLTQPQPGKQADFFSLLFVDVDSFKIVNDTLGHAVGDKLLYQVAQELQRLSPFPADVYRISGDEFALILPDHSGPQAETVAQSIQNQASYATNMVTGIQTTLSIGISVYPEDAQNATELLRHADSAMYSVKRAGRAQVRRYQDDQDAITERYQELVRALGQAHEQEQFHLVYQPVYRLSDQQMVKVEALIRWVHPTLGAVSPAEFIPVAEQSGLIVPIGLWVLREGCRAVQQWPGLTISINVSGLQLLRHDFAQQVTTILQETGLPPSRLELEITETAVLHEDTRAMQAVNNISTLGVSLSLDDYGSGYSNLHRLRTLHVNGLKLDQSIIRALEQPESRDFAIAVTQATVVLAKALNVSMTAEGIETPEIQALVRDLGCDLGQGYGLSRPLTPERLSEQYAIALLPVQLPS